MSLHILLRRTYVKNDSNRSQFSVYYWDVGYVRVALSIYRYPTDNRMLDIIKRLIFCYNVHVTLWCDKTSPVWKWQDTLSKTYIKVSIHASMCAFVNQKSSTANHYGGLYNIVFSIMVHLRSVIVILAPMNYSFIWRRILYIYDALTYFSIFSGMNPGKNDVFCKETLNQKTKWKNHIALC